MRPYLQLMRLDKPIGILLLLWPTLWGLWLAAQGMPDLKILLIFVIGVVLMRSAGCVINDFADRNFDGHVQRTQQRPLVTGAVTARQALLLFAGLVGISFALVLFLNPFTIALSVGAAALATLYPFMKRYTYLPQFVLGAAFAWAIPMAYSAQLNALPWIVWLIYLANLLWTVAYDTAYAMVDREDDLQVGIKSTAILFGRYDRGMIALCQGLALLCLCGVGFYYHLTLIYYASLVVAALIALYQQWLLKQGSRQRYFQAFLNNNWFGAVIFVGMVLALC